MKDIRIDQDGNLRCAKCGSSHFLTKRTFRAKAIGVSAGLVLTPVAALGTLGTRKKLKCQVCGEYNKTGNAKPFEPPPSAELKEDASVHMSYGNGRPSTTQYLAEKARRERILGRKLTIGENLRTMAGHGI